MSFANVDRIFGRRHALQRRLTVPGSIRGRGTAGRWWYTASPRQRTSLFAVSGAGTAVVGVVVSQLVAPFWWSSGRSHVSLATGATPVQQGTGLPATMDQQTLWGLITGGPGAAPAPAPATATAPAPAVSANAVTVAAVSGVGAAASPAAGGVAHPVHAAAGPAVPVAAASDPAVTPPAPAPVTAAAQVSSLVRRDLISSGTARLLCANNPAEVERLGLQSYCASLAAAMSAVSSLAPAAGGAHAGASVASGGAASLNRVRALAKTAPAAATAHTTQGAP